MGISHLGEHKRAAHEQIEALEKQWQQAQLAGDPQAMDKLLSDDYLGITATGEVVTKAQQLDHMRARKVLVTNLETSDLKIKLIGQIAIVTSRARLDGTSDGDPLHGEFRYTRVYQLLPSGTWKITNFEATRIPPPQAAKRTTAQPQ
jgi:ketosteroid isomerase-like protein